MCNNVHYKVHDLLAYTYLFFKRYVLSQFILTHEWLSKAAYASSSQCTIDIFLLLFYYYYYDFPVHKHKETDKGKLEKSSTGGLSQTCRDSHCKDYL